MDDWDRYAAVRTKPRRRLGDVPPGSLYYSPDLAPVVGQPAVTALGEEVQRSLLVQHLYGYMDFTAKLEHVYVNDVALRLAQGEAGISLSADVRFDAYRLYCDEAYHALAAMDLSRQVQRETGVVPLPGPDPSFLAELDSIFAPLDPGDRAIARLLFVVVSETLITGSLTRIPRDRRVVAAVREVADDHAHDEGRHHAYFSGVLSAAWPQLSDDRRTRLGPLVADFILLFLRPDLPRLAAALLACGVAPEAVGPTLEAAYPETRLVSEARSTARATVALFDRVGALAIPEVGRAFAAGGLIVEAPSGRTPTRARQERGRVRQTTRRGQGTSRRRTRSRRRTASRRQAPGRPEASRDDRVHGASDDARRSVRAPRHARARWRSPDRRALLAPRLGLRRRPCRREPGVHPGHR